MNIRFMGRASYMTNCLATGRGRGTIQIAKGNAHTPPHPPTAYSAKHYFETVKFTNLDPPNAAPTPADTTRHVIRGEGGVRQLPRRWRVQFD